MGLKSLVKQGSSLFEESVSKYIPWTSTEILVGQRLHCSREIFSHEFSFPLQAMNFYRNLSLTKVFLMLWSFLSVRNFRTLDMVVLEESSLGLQSSRNYLADLKMFSGLLKCCVFFKKNCIFSLPDILQKVF